tara:strand:+ start:512 stop:1513 length:1002 start_codon:yes stop_codon:yes gene_type:complete
MELSFFIALCFLGVLTVLLENRSILRYIYIPFLLAFLVVVRLNAFIYNGFEIDILTYAIEMKATSLDIYYLREFVFWFGIRIVYYFTQSDLFSFLILDFFWIYITFKITSKEHTKRLGQGLIIVLATSFPFFFGYENIYRQFYAMVVSLYAYSILTVKTNKAVFLFIISVFIHNLSLFLVPIFIIRKCYSFSIKDKVILSSFLSSIYIIILPYIMSFKDADPTEIDLSYLYLFLFIGLFIFYIYKFRNNVFRFISVTPSLLPIVLLISGFVLHNQEMIAERLSMMFIPFLLYDLYVFSNSITNSINRRALRLTLILIFTIPVFWFSSSMIFLS